MSDEKVMSAKKWSEIPYKWNPSKQRNLDKIYFLLLPIFFKKKCRQNKCKKFWDLIISTDLKMQEKTEKNPFFSKISRLFLLDQVKEEATVENTHTGDNFVKSMMSSYICFNHHHLLLLMMQCGPNRTYFASSHATPPAPYHKFLLPLFYCYWSLLFIEN